MLAFSNRTLARAILRTKSSGREYRSIRTRCFSMYFPIASSTFVLEGKKGSQARVWYKVMCQWYSIVFLENASFWFVLLASSKRTPSYLPIHGMSYPRGDTFLIPAHPVRSVCPRSVADAHCSRSETYIIEMTRIGFIMEWRGKYRMTYIGRYDIEET